MVTRPYLLATGSRGAQDRQAARHRGDDTELRPRPPRGSDPFGMGPRRRLGPQLASTPRARGADRTRLLRSRTSLPCGGRGNSRRDRLPTPSSMASTAGECHSRMGEPALRRCCTALCAGASLRLVAPSKDCAREIDSLRLRRSCSVIGRHTGVGRPVMACETR